MSNPNHDLLQAHAHSGSHRRELAASHTCGCYYCLAVFHPTEILKWVKENHGGGHTAFCPKCGKDAVLGSASGFPMTPDFLGRMRAYFYKNAPPLTPPKP